MRQKPREKTSATMLVTHSKHIESLITQLVDEHVLLDFTGKMIGLVGMIDGQNHGQLG
jgi:hypothetical protein